LTHPRVDLPSNRSTTTSSAALHGAVIVIGGSLPVLLHPSGVDGAPRSSRVLDLAGGICRTGCPSRKQYSSECEAQWERSGRRGNCRWPAVRYCETRRTGPDCFLRFSGFRALSLGIRAARLFRVCCCRGSVLARRNGGRSQA